VRIVLVERAENTLTVFEYRTSRRILGRKKQEVIKKNEIILIMIFIFIKYYIKSRYVARVEEI
jgi:hypothetical protein